MLKIGGGRRLKEWKGKELIGLLVLVNDVLMDVPATWNYVGDSNIGTW